MKNSRNAWIAIESKYPKSNPLFLDYTFDIFCSSNLYSDIERNDWMLVVTPQGEYKRAGRVFRVREKIVNKLVYFDRLVKMDGEVGKEKTKLSTPTSRLVNPIQWNEFICTLSKLTGKKVNDVSLIENPDYMIKNKAYIRELLQLAVEDDLLGPANGPREQILDMSVRDRYLVGKLAPMNFSYGGIEGLEGPLVSETDDGEPDQLQVHEGRHEPGAEFSATSGRTDAEATALDDFDLVNNQSLVPSSFGMTFCIDGDVQKIEVETKWGCYKRDYETKIYREKKNSTTGEVEQGSKVRVWQRVPCGGKITIELITGTISNYELDAGQPHVCIRGRVRDPNSEGDRLVSLFLVNMQEEPDQNKDSAWIFQPELIVRATDADENPAIFRRKPSIHVNFNDPEREALEMIYRSHVEFAVGHGVAVHAKTASEVTERAIEVRTEVLPKYEVPRSESPLHYPEERTAMQKMVEKGFLDMQKLAEMEQSRLVEALSILTKDYKSWIEEQRELVKSEFSDFDLNAHVALDRCIETHSRLVEGISVLSDQNDTKALKAFRFANRVMAKQRIHSLYSLACRRGKKVNIEEFNIPSNRSWRPFQLAFLLLSLPPFVDPAHSDRVNVVRNIALTRKSPNDFYQTKSIEPFADLLWYPTGGGKTEAYLGVAAFAMGIRRLQGEIGGYEGNRGLTVIMRYTLRLLTLQQFQRASTLICAMEEERQEASTNGDNSFGAEPFTIGLWVGNQVTPSTTDRSAKAIKDIRQSQWPNTGGESPGQLTSCPWCGSEVSDQHNIEVDKNILRTKIYCGDKKGLCVFSKNQSSGNSHPGLPILVVDEEIYHRPPTMLIATVDKFAMMAWRGETRTLFGYATKECPRHGLLWPEATCSGNHHKKNNLPSTQVKYIRPIRPPDLIIQDELHLISGPLGTMVGLYETAVDELCTWTIGDTAVQPKIIASTATVRKAEEQVNNIFMRRVSIFPPSGLDVADNFFSRQIPISQNPGRRYIGVCSPGSSRPAVLIRTYTAFLTAAQDLFESFGENADPYLTTVGYFNSLRELGSMKRLVEDDVQTRCYRVRMSLVDRPGLAQRSVRNVRELTSRVSTREIPTYLDQLEVKFKSVFDKKVEKFIKLPNEDNLRAVDVVLATNMFSVGVDVNRLGLMIVNGQPKGTAEYIQATSRVGRSSPGLVCTVLTWARPRDLSHYETFEHFHATFYKHVEAQSVTPFSPRAMDRGLTGVMLSILRLEHDEFNPNLGANELDRVNKQEIIQTTNVLLQRVEFITEQSALRELATAELKQRIDEWASKVGRPGQQLAYEKKGKNRHLIVPLLHRPGTKPWGKFTVPLSMREVEPGVRLIVGATNFVTPEPAWTQPTSSESEEEGTL